MREGTVTANGVEFSYLEDGDGPLALLLHGFPDNARTWERQIEGLAAAGYRAVAPNTRGYAPTTAPADGFFDSATLAHDANALIEALSGEAAYVIGHDWGAATTYYLCTGYPGAVRRAVTLGVPHPGTIAMSLMDPATIHNTFHFWFFQMQGLPEAAISANDFAFIDYIWSIWSPGFDDAAHVADVKRTLAQPGALSAALAYYRAMFDPSKQDPALSAVRDAVMTPSSVPTLSILGSHDVVRSADGASQAAFFSAPFRFESVGDAGHFVHREQPELVTKMICDWLAG